MGFSLTGSRDQRTPGPARKIIARLFRRTFQNGTPAPPQRATPAPRSVGLLAHPTPCESAWRTWERFTLSVMGNSSRRGAEYIQFLVVGFGSTVAASVQRLSAGDLTGFSVHPKLPPGTDLKSSR